MYRRFGKRLLDIVCSGLGLIVLSPLLLIIGITINIESRGGALFAQSRVGQGGRWFTLYKFRSMIPHASEQGKGHYFDGEHDPRITRLGRLLRKSSLDELPELWNVLKGEMSLVGPRPMLPYQYDYLSTEQRRRFAVRPGITGLAQVMGRNTLPWSKRITLDINYVENVNFVMDLRLLVQTLAVTVSSRGVDHTVTQDVIEDFIPKGGA